MQRRSFGLLLLIIAVIGLDQWTKQLILGHVGPDDIFKVSPFLNIILRWNTGVSFSFLSGHGSLLLFLNIIIVCALTIWLMRTPNIPLSLIIGGALGNILDRIFYGAVIDFIDFHLYAWHFAVFNIADSFISIGIFLFILTNYLKEKKLS
jgi:signal peptidase II